MQNKNKEMNFFQTNLPVVKSTPEVVLGLLMTRRRKLKFVYIEINFLRVFRLVGLVIPELSGGNLVITRYI